MNAEDFLYKHSIHLVDEAILRVRDEVEKGTFEHDKNQFYILSYLMSKPALRWSYKLSVVEEVTYFSLSLHLQ